MFESWLSVKLLQCAYLKSKNPAQILQCNQHMERAVYSSTQFRLINSSCVGDKVESTEGAGIHIRAPD